MKKIEKLLESLDLIYYEYDPLLEALVLGAKGAQRDIGDELIKVTHALTTHNITFYVDARQQIFFKKRATLLGRLKNYVDSLCTDIKNRNSNIYILSDKRVRWAKNIPLFKVVHLEHSGDFKGYDALIFTSKNSIYSLEAQGKNYKNIPSYVIAPQTGKVLKKLGGNLRFVGKEKHGNAFAKELLLKLRHKKALYLRGESVVSDLTNILNAGGVECDERVVYKTECEKPRRTKRLPKGSSIIFSSPSTIECFFKNMEWDESFNAIAIGKTTASYFPPHVTPNIAETTSLESCVKKAIDLKGKL